LLAFAPGVARAEPPTLPRAIALYEQFDWEGAERQLRALLVTAPEPSVAARAHVYLALIDLNFRFDARGGQEEFRQALQADPLVELPPGAPPKARRIFEQVQAAPMPAPRSSERPTATAANLEPAPAAATSSKVAVAPKRSSAPWWLVGTGAFLTAAGGGVTAYEFASKQSLTSVSRSQAETANTVGYVGQTALGVGVAVLASGVLWALLRPPAAPEATP
jgi:hypothetical protein